MGVSSHVVAQHQKAVGKYKEANNTVAFTFVKAIPLSATPMADGSWVEVKVCLVFCGINHSISVWKKNSRAWSEWIRKTGGFELLVYRFSSLTTSLKHDPTNSLFFSPGPTPTRNELIPIATQTATCIVFLWSQLDVVLRNQSSMSGFDLPELHHICPWDSVTRDPLGMSRIAPTTGLYLFEVCVYPVTDFELYTTPHVELQP